MKQTSFGYLVKIYCKNMFFTFILNWQTSALFFQSLDCRNFPGFSSGRHLTSNLSFKICFESIRLQCEIVEATVRQETDTQRPSCTALHFYRQASRQKELLALFFRHLQSKCREIKCIIWHIKYLVTVGLQLMLFLSQEN